MRKPSAIPLGLVAALSFTMLACKEKQQDVKSCVDPSGKMVDDWNCEQRPEAGHTSAGQAAVTNLLLYRWAYGGLYQNGYVKGYRSTPEPSMEYVSPRSEVGSGIVSAGSRSAFVSRGGFGGSFAGGEGAGE